MLTSRSESDGLSGDVCFGCVGMCEREREEDVRWCCLRVR